MRRQLLWVSAVILLAAGCAQEQPAAPAQASDPPGQQDSNTCGMLPDHAALKAALDKAKKSMPVEKEGEKKHGPNAGGGCCREKKGEGDAGCCKGEKAAASKPAN